MSANTGTIEPLRGRMGRGMSRRYQRGQSLIIAIVVMFVLLFIGSVFVGIVARNLLNSGRAKETVSAGQFAEAGIKFADLYLQNSPEGADWRPAPVAPANIDPRDPDANWLRKGYSRVDLNGGRALIKVTYRPGTMTDPLNPLNTVLNPLGKYLRIDSVGRVGNLNPNDPTSYLNTPSPRLRREYVAYKAIGLTDSLRYVTFKNKDTKNEAFFGIQPFGIPLFMQMGGLPLNNFYPLPAFLHTTGAPMQINGPLHLGNNVILAVDRRNGESIRVADNITVDPEVTGDPTRYSPRINVLETDAPNADPTVLGATKPAPVVPSDGNFNTYQGLIRDASGIPDISGYVRAISRLDPPLIDAPDPATGLTRYIQLTRNSGKFLANPNNPNQPFDLGVIGLGAGIYIDNELNSQRPSGLVATESLKQIWLDPANNQGDGKWNHQYYMPSSANLEFGYEVAQDRDPGTSALIPNSYSAQPGVRITKDRPFVDIQGQQLSNTSLLFTFFIYKPANLPPVIKLECNQFREALTQAPFNMTEHDIDKFLPDFNGVIYGAGSLRVRGLLPATKNVQVRRESSSDPLTDAQIRDMVTTSVSVVSGENIFIEGSLIREEAKSMIALMAVDNVAVNASMFMANQGSRVSNPGQQNQLPPYHSDITTSSVGLFDFLFGENPTGYVDQLGQPVPINLLVRHGVADSATTYASLFVNRSASGNYVSDRFVAGTPPPAIPGTGVQPLYWFKTGDVADFTDITSFPEAYPLGVGATGGPPLNLGQDHFQYWAFPLLSNGLKQGSTTGPYVFTGDAAYAWPQNPRNSLEFDLDQTYVSGARGNVPPPADYLLGGLAVVPMDVRIEAMIYAENGSFFIIPGLPLNPRIDDSRQQAVANAKITNPSAPAGSMSRLSGTNPMFPFGNEPVDCRITIVGAISENSTATAGEQAEWMKLWGWVPQVYGSTGLDVNFPGVAKQEIPRQHLFVRDVADGSTVDMRTQAEQTFFDATNKIGITRGIRFVYDPALVMPYIGYLPGNRAFRFDFATFDPANQTAPPDPDRTLPPLPRLPVCPGFVFSGEIR